MEHDDNLSQVSGLLARVDSCVEGIQDSLFSDADLKLTLRAVDMPSANLNRLFSLIGYHRNTGQELCIGLGRLSAEDAAQGPSFMTWLNGKLVEAPQEGVLRLMQDMVTRIIDLERRGTVGVQGIEHFSAYSTTDGKSADLHIGNTYNTGGVSIPTLGSEVGRLSHKSVAQAIAKDPRAYLSYIGVLPISIKRA
jgi:hypothetical protein